MPKLAANLTMLYNEVDFMDRFAAAAKANSRTASARPSNTPPRWAASK